MAKAVRAKKPRKTTKRVKKVRKLRKRRVVTKDDITTSKLEVDFGKWLTDVCRVPVEPQYQIAKKWFDFKVRSAKILIEMDGDFYHCNPEVYPNGPINRMQKKNMINDRKKTALAFSEGFLLIRIWEKDFRKKPEEVKNRIQEIVQKYFLKEAQAQ